MYRKLHPYETGDVIRVLSMFSKVLVRHVDLFQFRGLQTAALMGIITDVMPSELWIQDAWVLLLSLSLSPLVTSLCDF